MPRSREHQAVSWPEPGNHFLGFNLIREIGRGPSAGSSRHRAGPRRAAGRAQGGRAGQAGSRKLARTAASEHRAGAFRLSRGHATGLAAICMPFLGQATLSVVHDAILAEGRVPIQARQIWEAIQAANADHEIAGTGHAASYPAGRVVCGGRNLPGRRDRRRAWPTPTAAAFPTAT